MNSTLFKDKIKTILYQKKNQNNLLQCYFNEWTKSKPLNLSWLFKTLSNVSLNLWIFWVGPRLYQMSLTLLLLSTPLINIVHPSVNVNLVSTMYNLMPIRSLPNITIKLQTNSKSRCPKTSRMDINHMQVQHILNKNIKH